MLSALESRSLFPMERFFFLVEKLPQNLSKLLPALGQLVQSRADRAGSLPESLSQANPALYT